MKKIKNFVLSLFLILPCIALLSACGNPKKPDNNLKTFTGITFNDANFDYDGNEHEITITGNLPEQSNVAYTNNKATNSGTYSAKAVITCEGYNSLTLNATLTINKLNYNLENVDWNYSSPFTFDGEEKQVSVVGDLPSGVTVKSYTNNKQTDAGNYTATVEFNYDKTNHNKPTIANLNWTINKATFLGITFNSEVVEYDTCGHSLQLVGNIPQNSVVKITYNGEEVESVSEVGTYEVVLTITNKNYETFTKTSTLTISSKEKRLYSASLNGKVYFQNDLDDEKLYSYDGSTLKKVNNDIPNFITPIGNNLCYTSASLLSNVVKCYNGLFSYRLVEDNAQYLISDGTFIYYAINNLMFNTENNGIYKVEIDTSKTPIQTKGEPIRIVQNKAAYLAYNNGFIYYSNLSDSKKLYKVSTLETNATNGTMLFDEKVSDIICVDNCLYFNSTKTMAGVNSASAIRKYNISNNENIKLTTDSGKYLTVIGNNLYYINNDKITSTLFGDGIYTISTKLTVDNNFPGTKVLSCIDNGYSSLTGFDTTLYFYKLNDKHFYSYDLNSQTETDLMENFVVKQEVVEPSGFAKITEYNNEIYYTNPNDDGCLYKYNTTSQKHYKVLSNSVSNVYFNNGYMYYSTYISVNYALWKLDLKTNETTKISSSRCDNLIFVDNTIYYVKVGSAFNNYIMKMNNDGTGVTELYKKANLAVSNFVKVGDDIYFTTNTGMGGINKYLAKYTISTNTVTEYKDLDSKIITINNDMLYSYNHKTSSIDAINLTTMQAKQLITNVDVNNMIVNNNKIYYSTYKKDNIGFYEYDISSAKSKKLSDKCADAMTVYQNNIYFIQTSITYQNDYPQQANGDAKLYMYNGSIIKAL